MPIGSVVSWIVANVGLGSVRPAIGIRKDVIDVKKAKLETQRLQKELDPPVHTENIFRPLITCIYSVG